MPADPIYTSPERLAQFEANPAVIAGRLALRRRQLGLTPEKVQAGCARRMAKFDRLPRDEQEILREGGAAALRAYRANGGLIL